MKILCFCMVCSSSNVLFFSWAKLDDSNVPSSTTGEGKRSHRSLSIQLKQMISLCTHTLFGRAQCYWNQSCIQLVHPALEVNFQEPQGRMTSMAFIEGRPSARLGATISYSDSELTDQRCESGRVPSAAGMVQVIARNGFTLPLETD